MRIWTNQNIKILFLRILICIVSFALVSAVCMAVWKREAAVCILVCSVFMGIAILLVCYRYFSDQDKMMEDAAAKIREYISGDRDARIACDEEGEIYRLFHEINSLASILNAQAQKEERARKFLKQTISDISHQLKTPLAALNIYNGIIQSEAGEKDLPTISEFCGLAERELERMEALVKNLLNIAKFDAGTIVIQKSLQTIFSMMEDVKRQVSFRAKEEGKKIVFSGSESLSFLCDRTWIIEAVGNLVKNALDHTKSGNHVKIAWGQSAATVWITVQDDGSGIHPEDLYHIFKRFYRSRYSKDTQGVGLGLSLAKAVTEAHNGTIEVDSRLGLGTSFTMYFLITTEL